MAGQYRVGVRIECDGQKEFANALRDANSALKNFDAQIEAVSSSMDKNGDNIEELNRLYDLYEKKQQTLNSLHSATKSQIETVSKAYGDESRQVNAMSAVLAGVEKNMNNTQKSMKSIQTTLSDNTKKFKENEDTLKKYDSELKKNQSQLNSNKDALEQNGNSALKLSERQKLLQEREKLLTDQQKVLKEQLELINDTTENAEEKSRQYSDQLLECESNLKLLESELKNVRSELISTIQGFESFERTMNTIDSTLTSMSNKIRNFGAGLTAGITAPLVALGKSSIDVASQIETYTKQMEVMTGSSEKASSVIKELQQFGLVTPYNLDELAETVTLMMNYGIQADESVRMLKLLADVGQGSGEKLQHIALAYAQMSASGKIMLQDINQMINAGFSPLLELSEETGVSIGELRDSVSDGGVTFEDITHAIERATGEGGRFNNMLVEMAETWDAKLANFQEAIDDYFKKPIGDILKSYLIPLMDKVSEIVIKFSDLQEPTQKLIVNFGLLSAVIGPATMVVGQYGMAIGAISQSTTKGIVSLGKYAGSFLDFSSKLVSTKGAVDFINKNFGETIKNFNEHKGLMNKILGSISSTYSNRLAEVVNSTIKFGTDTKAGFTKSFSEVGSSLTKVLNPIKDQLNTFMSMSWVNKLSGNELKFNNLLPGTTFTENLSSSLLSAKQKVFDFSGSVGSKLGELAGVVGEKTANISNRFVELGTNVGKSLSPIGNLLKSVGGLAGTFLNSFNQIGGVLQDGINYWLQIISSSAFKFVGAFSKFFLWGSVVALIVAGFGLLNEKMGLQFKIVGEKLLENGGAMITNFVEMLNTRVTDLITQGSELLTYLLQLGAQIIGPALDGLLSVIINAVSAISEGSLLSDIIGGIVSILNSIVTTILAKLPEIVKVGLQFFGALATGLAENLPTILSWVPLAILSIIQAFAQNIGEFVNIGRSILDTLIEGFRSNDFNFIQTFLDIIYTLVNSFNENIDSIMQLGLDILNAMINGIVDNLPQILDAVIQVVTFLIFSFVENLPRIIELGVQLLVTLISGILKALPDIIIAVAKLIGTLLKALWDHKDDVIKGGMDILSALVEGILKLLGTLFTTGVDLIQKLVDGLLSLDFPQIGKDIVNGVLEGLSSMGTALWEGACNLGNSIVEGFKSFLDINSPSRKMRKLGRQTAEGTIVGVKDRLPQVAKVSKELGRTIQLNTQRAVGQITFESLAKDPIERKEYMTAPQFTAPEVEVPSINLPQMRVKAPEIVMSELEVPEITVPELNVPTLNMPEVKVQTPTVDMPTVDIPKLTTSVETNVIRQNKVSEDNSNLKTTQTSVSDINSNVSTEWSSLWGNVTGELDNSLTTVNSEMSGFSVDTINLMNSYSITQEDLVSNLLSTVTLNATSFFSEILIQYATFTDTIISLTNTLVNTILAIVTAMISQFIAIIDELRSQVVAKFTELVNQVISVCNTLPPQLYQVGVSAMNDFIDGMNSQKQRAEDTASDVVQAVLKAFKDGLGIHSPAREMFPIGDYTIQGFMKGMTQPDLNSFVNNILGDMITSFQNGNFNATQLVEFLAEDSTINSLINRLNNTDFSEVLGANISKAGSSLTYPVPGFEYRINSPYGPRGSGTHTGVDLYSGYGNPIVAALSGIVDVARWYYGYGNAVRIQHGNNFATLYGHMLGNLAVKEGQSVTAGQTVGYSDNTGNSFGDHLHFETLVNGKDVNPTPYLDGATVSASPVQSLIAQIQTALAIKNGMAMLSAWTDGWEGVTGSILESAQKLMANPKRIGGYNGLIDYTPYTGGGTLDQWIATALAITGVDQANAGNLKKLVMGESGGEPNIVQGITDINSGNGGVNLARGIAQTIPSTFLAYMKEGMNQIYNPVHNLVASIMYQLAVYHKILNHAGYAIGTRYVPDNMVATIHKGEAILPASQNPYTNSGGRYLEEIVEKVASHLNGGGDITVNQTFTNANPTPSQIMRKARNTLKKLNR